MNIYKRIHDIGLIPVVDYCDCFDIEELVNVLKEINLPIIEFDGFNYDAIKLMKKEYPGIIVGLAYLEDDEIDAAIEAGVDYINPSKLSLVKDKQINIIPEYDNLSIEELKEIEYIKIKKANIDDALKVNPELKLIVEDLDNEEVNKYLSQNNILAYSDKLLVNIYDLDKLKEDGRLAINNMLNISIKHVGLNEENGNALELANAYADFFNGNIRKTSKGYFGSELVEIMNIDKAKGLHGHIGLTCTNIDRAKRFLLDKGYLFDEDSATYDDNGNTKFIYLKDEIGGFAIHFVK